MGVALLGTAAGPVPVVRKVRATEPDADGD